MGPFTALASCACRYRSIFAQQPNTVKGPLLRRYASQKIKHNLSKENNVSGNYRARKSKKYVFHIS